MKQQFCLEIGEAQDKDFATSDIIKVVHKSVYFFFSIDRFLGDMLEESL